MAFVHGFVVMVAHARDRCPDFRLMSPLAPQLDSSQHGGDRHLSSGRRTAALYGPMVTASWVVLMRLIGISIP